VVADLHRRHASGTTLLEQVLTGHLKVFGAGDFETFTVLLFEYTKRESIAPAYPDLMESLSANGIVELALRAAHS